MSQLPRVRAACATHLCLPQAADMPALLLSLLTSAVAGPSLDVTPWNSTTDRLLLYTLGKTGSTSLELAFGCLTGRSRLPFVRNIAADGIWRDDQYLALVAQSLEAATGESTVHAEWAAFSDRIDYVEVDALDSQTWDPLCETLAGREQVLRAVYLATPPTLYGPVARGFEERGLIVPDMRIVLEKPVGRNFESAREINDEVGRYFSESQVFRIDHYLGKETVQNLLALRFGNAIFEPLWRREVIDHVQITVAEELGVGDRVGF